MDEKEKTKLLDQQESRQLVLRKRYFNDLLLLKPLTEEQKTKVNNYIIEIDLRLEHIDPDLEFNNMTYMDSINVIDAVLDDLSFNIT